MNAGFFAKFIFLEERYFYINITVILPFQLPFTKPGKPCDENFLYKLADSLVRAIPWFGCSNGPDRDWEKAGITAI
jgi:hypothetical protein